MKVRRRRPRARGQAIVEFALVAPLFFLVLFGFVEFALINASIGTYNFAAKEGARYGSFLGRTVSNVDQLIVAQIRQQVSGVVMAQPIKIEIFRSDLQGNILTTSTGVPQEAVYDINGNLIGTDNWPVQDRNDSLLNADYLGVRITYQYTYLTSFISGGLTGITLTALSVQRIEPQDYQSLRHLPSPMLASVSPSAVPPAWRGEQQMEGTA